MLRDDGTRGVVLAMSGGWATIMSPDGSFRQVRSRPAWRVGDDVLVVAAVTPLRRAAPWLGAWAAAVAAAAVTFGVMSSLAASRTVLYVDIEGSRPVTLAVNAQGDVLSAVWRRGALPVKVRRGEGLQAAVEALALAEAKTPGGVMTASATTPTGVFVTFYAPKGSQPAASFGRAVEAAAVAAHATLLSP